MTGRRLEFRPYFPWWAGAFLLIAIAMAAGAWFGGNPDLAIGALLPAALAVALFLSREPRFSAVFTDDGLEAETAKGPEILPYSAIERVWIPSRRKIDPEKVGAKPFPIVIGHPEGTVRIPALIDTPSEDVYRFLLDRVPRGGSDEVHEDLRDYLAEQVQEFGAERVWSYRPSPRKVRPAPRRFRAVTLAMVLVGIAWLVVGGSRDGEKASGWLGGGASLFVYGGIALVASFADLNRRFKGWKQSGLVIGPVGVAMIQGDVRGEMSWEELNDLKLTDRRSFQLTATSDAGRGILMKVSGATILIPDLYDRPIFTIYRNLLQYWR